MKTQTLFPSFCASVGLIAGVHGEGTTLEPAIPVGKLTVSATVVEPNVIPDLAWEITHPQSITDIVEIDEEEDIVTVGDKSLIVKVSMIGTGITSNRGKKQHESVSEIKFGSGPWEHVFTGKGSAVDQSEILIERELAPDTQIYFRSRFVKYPEWRNNYSDEVQVLVNGDSPPSNPSSGGVAISAEEYMKPYTIDGKLSLGPLDLIYAAELTHTNTSHSGYDMQDSIVLVTFSEVETDLGTTKGEVKENVNGGKSNNGHGNNADGVDVSNPGQGNGGPNGREDTDYNGDGIYEDDENKHNGGSNKNNKRSSRNDWSGYNGRYGSGYQGGGYKKRYYQRRDRRKP